MNTLGRGFRLLALASIAFGIGSCGLPVRVGVEHARAAQHGNPAPVVQASAPQLRVFTSRPAEGAVSVAVPAVAVAPVVVAQAPVVQVPVVQVPVVQAPVAPPPPPALSVLTLPPVPQPVGPDDVVGARLEAKGAIRRQIVTFGQVFARGRVPRGSTVVAHAASGPLPTQLDVKTTHPDGSVRMGVVSIQTAAPVDVTLRRAAIRPTDALVNLGELAGRYDARVRLTIHGTGEPARHDFDLAGLLSKALLTGQVSFWLHGPLATEGRIEVPVTGSMRLVADVRAHADGSVMTDIQFNNDIAMRPVGGALLYDATIIADGKIVLNEQDIRHFQYQTWHRVVWSKEPPSVHVVRDTAALARAGAVQNYDLSTGVSADLVARLAAAMAGPGYGILGNAGLTRYMGTTGGRPEIGATTQSNTVWLMTQHPDAERHALAQADAAGSVPWHFYDADARTYVNANRYPKLWIDYRGGRWDTMPLTQAPDPEKSGWIPDNAHQPALSYVLYILTGSRYRLDQMEAQANFAILSQSPGFRGGHKAIVVNIVEQVRGRAWAFRAIDEIAFVAPDDAPLRLFYQGSVRYCIEYLQAETRWRTIGEAHGYIGDPPQDHPGGAGTAPWQQDFLANVLAMSALRGTEGAREIVAWMSNFVAGRFTSADKGFRPNNGTAFGLVLYPLNPRAPFMTWREVEQENIARKQAKDGNELASTDVNTMRIARGALASVVTVTDRPDARQALGWVNANLPGVTAREFQRDPTWNIIPMTGGTALAQ